MPRHFYFCACWDRAGTSVGERVLWADISQCLRPSAAKWADQKGFRPKVSRNGYAEPRAITESAVGGISAGDSPLLAARIFSIKGSRNWRLSKAIVVSGGWLN